MTDKEKITEILKAYTKKHNIMASVVILEEYAEELVANGIIAPPCKVGDMVYVIKSGKIYTETVRGIKQGVCGLYLLISNGENEKYSEPKYFGIDRISKDVFLTKEEAERALVTDKNVGSKKELNSNDR